MIFLVVVFSLFVYIPSKKFNICMSKPFNSAILHATSFLISCQEFERVFLEEFERVFQCFDEDGDGKILASNLGHRLGVMDSGDMFLQKAKVAVVARFEPPHGSPPPNYFFSL